MPGSMCAWSLFKFESDIDGFGKLLSASRSSERQKPTFGTFSRLRLRQRLANLELYILPRIRHYGIG